MTAVELQAAKQSLIETILQIEDPHVLDRLKKYLNRLHPASVTEETIGKEEILTGIDAGLREVKQWKSTGEKRQSLKEFIDEL